ncbi:MAG: ABC transporter permease [Microbacteriaceae bacterium]|nr:ABC transporter permease [Microbacteriaceae bacterium]
MSKLEVTPGMFSKVESKPTLKTPIALLLSALVVFIFFGFLGKPGDVSFIWSDEREAFQLPAFTINSMLFCTVVGAVLLLIAAFSIFRTLSAKKTPVWLIAIFGLGAMMAILGWLATGAIQGVQMIFILSNTLVLAIPLILGGMAGVMSERVGVVNIAIEGQLLTGAFVSAVVGTMTGNLYVGMVAAMVAAGILSMVLASLAIKYLVEQIIIGVLLNVLVIGVTNFLHSAWLDNDSSNLNYPGTFDKIAIPLLSDIPVLGQVLFNNRITVYLMFIIVPVLWYILFRTKLGLRARAVGEHPLAADTVGINVARTRFWWVTLGGMVAGLGGAALTIGNVGSFGREMSAGQGFIALAVVILGRWQPIYVTLAALLFGFTIILRVWANQVSPGIPVDFITMVPYLVTLVAVAGFAGKVRPPAASGQPYIKG